MMRSILLQDQCTFFLNSKMCCSALLHTSHPQSVCSQPVLLLTQ